MFLMALLLISSMALREYAHFIDHAHQFHGQSGSAHSSFDHEAKFHFVPEAESSFEPLCWRQQVEAVVQVPSQSKPSADFPLLPETRAPPACV